MAVRAGAAKVDITPPLGLAMGGYGSRQGGAVGVVDPLHARALVLSDGSTELALVVCDLLGVSTDLVAAARQRIAAEHGLGPDHVMVAATHTHSGPAGLRLADAPDYVAVTARRVSDAVGAARAGLTPVQLTAGRVGLSTVSQNRRHPDGPIEDTLRVLVADPGREHPPVATLVSYACHSTVREHDNLSYSADWPGAMARLVESSVGGTAVYLQGAAGDLNPVWSAHDHTEVERVGGIVGAAAVRLVHEMRPLTSAQWCINLSWSEHVEVRANGMRLDGVSLAGARREIEVARRVRPPAEEARAAVVELDGRLAEPAADPGTAEGLATRRRLLARRNQMDTERYFARVAATRLNQRVELQAFRISPGCGVVSLPGEFFAVTGRELARRAEREAGIGFPLVAGYANGSVGYAPTSDQYPEGGYEVGMTQFEAGAAEEIAGAGLSLLTSLY